MEKDQGDKTEGVKGERKDNKFSGRYMAGYPVRQKRADKGQCPHARIKQTYQYGIRPLSYEVYLGSGNDCSKCNIDRSPDGECCHELLF